MISFLGWNKYNFYIKKKSPILDHKELFITWFMLLLKYRLCDVIFKLSFFKIPFSSFTWTVINVNKWTHLKEKKTLSLALPLSCWENHLPSSGSWFPHLKIVRLLWRSSLPLRCLGKVPDETGSSRVIHYSVLERKPNSQDEEFPFNTYLVIMLIFKPHNQSESKSHLNGIYKRIRKWRKWGHVSKAHLISFPFLLCYFLTE